MIMRPAPLHDNVRTRQVRPYPCRLVALDGNATGGNSVNGNATGGSAAGGNATSDWIAPKGNAGKGEYPYKNFQTQPRGL